MSFMQQMAEFDVRRGKTPINPAVIEGFGQGQPPPPPLPPQELGPEPASARDIFGDPVEPAPPGPPASPLVALGHAAGLGAQMAAPVAQARPEVVWVRDLEAGYRGRAVTLTSAEQTVISKVVLKAIKRSLDEQYREISGGSLPRKPRAKKAPVSAKKPRGGS